MGSAWAGAIAAKTVCLPWLLARSWLPGRYGLGALLVERGVALVLGLGLDALLWAIARKWHVKPNLALFLHASSHLTFVALGRPTDALLQSLALAALLRHLVACLDYAPHGASFIHFATKC